MSRQCGSKPPHGPGICVLPRLPSQSLEQPRGGPGLVEGQGGTGVPIQWHKPVCTEVLFPIPPPQFSLPWVTQLQLISLAHPGLYLGHGACCSEAVKESWLTRWRLGSPRGCTAGGERGTRDGDKGQDLDCPAPSGSACQVPFGAAGEPEQPDLHKCPDPVLPAARLSCPRRGRSAPALWLRGQPRSVQRHCQGAGMARSPLPAVGRLGHGYLAKVTAGAGLGEGPRCPDTCFHLLPAPPAGHRSTSPPWPAGTGSPPPPGTPSSSKGDAVGYPTLPGEGRGRPLPAPLSLPPKPEGRGCRQPAGLVPWSC